MAVANNALMCVSGGRSTRCKTRCNALCLVDLCVMRANLYCLVAHYCRFFHAGCRSNGAIACTIMVRQVNRLVAKHQILDLVKSA